MPKRVKILAKLWLFYFMLTIAVIGFFFSGLFYLPLYLFSRLSPRARAWPERALWRAVKLLMRVQPWYKASVQIDLPRSDRGLLIVSNHRSHLDVFILLSRIAGIRVLAKSSLFRIPFLGLYMRATKQIAVERGALDAWVRAMDEVGRRLASGERVHVFPELTRCEPGYRGVRPFAAGPFLAAIQNDVDVVPLVIRNTDAVWPKGRREIHPVREVSVTTLAPVRARDFDSAFDLKNEVHRRMQQALS